MSEGRAILGVSKKEGQTMRETWTGSGINSDTMEREFTCLSCGWEGEAVGTTDDNGFMLYAECPNCKYEMTIDLEAERETADWDNDREEY
jgi:transcription elongation factor Elf1